MRKILTILFLVCTLLVQAQDRYNRVVDWQFIPDSVVALNDSTYIMKAEPRYFNEPGAADRIVGNYVIDHVLNSYKVIDSTSTTITVLDEQGYNLPPQTGQLARCYRSSYNGEASYVGVSDFYPLNLNSIWRLIGWYNDIQWRHGIDYSLPFKRLVLDTTYVPDGNEVKGTTYWDDDNRTVSVDLGKGVVMQVNQEALAQIYNDTGDTIKDGRAVGFDKIINDLTAVRYASNYERHQFFGVSTEDIPPDSAGMVVSLIGKVRGLNTGSLTVGPIYLDTLGYFTNTKPVFPIYTYPLGFVQKTGVTDGVIQFRSDGVNFTNSINDIMDGAIRETFDFRTFSDGVNIKGVLSNPTGDTTLTLVFSDGWHDYVNVGATPLSHAASITLILSAMCKI